jgi:hypothetical protein
MPCSCTRAVYDGQPVCRTRSRDGTAQYRIISKVS